MRSLNVFKKASDKNMKTFKNVSTTYQEGLHIKSFLIIIAYNKKILHKKIRGDI